MNDAYRAALVDARATMFRIDAEAERRILAALDSWIAELGRLIAAARTPDEQRRLLASRDAALRARTTLERRLLGAVADGRSASFEDTLAAWEEATRSLAARADIPDAALGEVMAARVTVAGVYESGGGRAATWRTLLAGHTADMVAEADAIVRQALLGGMGPEELARRLRRYVEGYADAFGDALDLSRIPVHLRGAARRMRSNALRIAFSEIHNARAEAELGHFIHDPFVAAVRWTLSPNRGSVRTPDQCDGLARIDWFGLGPGVFPVTRVPPPPHPHDRCERVPVTRASSQINAPKPNPSRALVSEAEARRAVSGGKLSDAAWARVWGEMQGTVALGERISTLAGVKPFRSHA